MVFSGPACLRPLGELQIGLQTIFRSTYTSGATAVLNDAHCPEHLARHLQKAHYTAPRRYYPPMQCLRESKHGEISSSLIIFQGAAASLAKRRSLAYEPNRVACGQRHFKI